MERWALTGRGVAVGLCAVIIAVNGAIAETRLATCPLEDMVQLVQESVPLPSLVPGDAAAFRWPPQTTENGAVKINDIALESALENAIGWTERVLKPRWVPQRLNEFAIPLPGYIGQEDALVFRYQTGRLQFQLTHTKCRMYGAVRVAGGGEAVGFANPGKVFALLFQEPRPGREGQPDDVVFLRKREGGLGWRLDKVNRVLTFVLVKPLGGGALEISTDPGWLRNLPPLLLAPPPRIVPVSPVRGAKLRSRKPVISASFVGRGYAVDPDRARIKVDGIEVTQFAQVTADGFRYMPETPLPVGKHTVTAWVCHRGRTNRIPFREESWGFEVVAEGNVPRTGTDLRSIPRTRTDSPEKNRGRITAGLPVEPSPVPLLSGGSFCPESEPASVPAEHVIEARAIGAASNEARPLAALVQKPQTRPSVGSVSWAYLVIGLAAALALAAAGVWLLLRRRSGG